MPAKLKTNAVMIREEDAERIRAPGMDAVQISVYSHRPGVHDAIAKLPGSLKRSLEGARLMRGNAEDYRGVQALAAELGAQFTLDPTITPMMDGGRSVLALNIDPAALQSVFRDFDPGG